MGGRTGCIGPGGEPASVFSWEGGGVGVGALGVSALAAGLLLVHVVLRPVPTHRLGHQRADAAGILPPPIENISLNLLSVITSEPKRQRYCRRRPSLSGQCAWRPRRLGKRLREGGATRRWRGDKSLETLGGATRHALGGATRHALGGATRHALAAREGGSDRGEGTLNRVLENSGCGHVVANDEGIMSVCPKQRDRES